MSSTCDDNESDATQLIHLWEQDTTPSEHAAVLNNPIYYNEKGWEKRKKKLNRARAGLIVFKGYGLDRTLGRIHSQRLNKTKYLP